MDGPKWGCGQPKGSKNKPKNASQTTMLAQPVPLAPNLELGDSNSGNIQEPCQVIACKGKCCAKTYTLVLLTKCPQMQTMSIILKTMASLKICFMNLIGWRKVPWETQLVAQYLVHLGTFSTPHEVFIAPLSKHRPFKQRWHKHHTYSRNFSSPIST